MSPEARRQLDEALKSATRSVGGPTELNPPEQARLVALARAALGAGQGSKAIPLLAALNRKLPLDVEIVTLHGVTLRLEQRLVEAAEVFAAARARGVDDPGVLQGLAQTRYELGLPAATLFGEADRANPGNLDVLRNRAAAMASEGDRAAAIKLLLDTLRTNPGWLDGHKSLATMRWTGGDQQDFAASYAAAARAEPGNPAVWLAWFGAVAQTQDWEQARAIIAEAETHFGATAAILSAQLFIACEGNDPARGDALLAKTAHITGDSINLCRIRHALRQHRFEAARDLILPLLDKASAGLFWPYASLAWRLLGDPRAQWLDRPETTIQSRAIALDSAEMGELADVLRALHTMEQPYAEQTVRGGTQTDRSIMLRHEPILQRTRTAWLEAIRANIDELPVPEQGHPFLRDARSQLLLGGSWSVRLRAGGHNVPHTHPMGWMSSSLYVAMPDAAVRGPAPAGHIIFGAPPPELGLDLAPYCSIAPEPGLVVTFPSLMWHAVEPFAAGERLMIALDIRPPQF